ncbi:hypothetical protein U1Q18_022846, partial [Sarracenia purpurea var. burkii]
MNRIWSAVVYCFRITAGYEVVRRISMGIDAFSISPAAAVLVTSFGEVLRKFCSLVRL